VGRGSIADGDLAVAIGDDAKAIGPGALNFTHSVTLGNDLTLRQIEGILYSLAIITAIHSALPDHTGHVEQLQRAIRLLVTRANELSAIARHEARRQAQSASSSEAAAVPQETQTAPHPKTD